MNYDSAAIVAALETLIGVGNVCEIRALCDRKRTDAGYFDDFEKAAKLVLNYAADGEVKGIYFVLNEIDRNLLSRACNRFERYAGQTTSDKDVTSRRWLYVDCDPKRPAGISSTDAECQLAMDRAEQIREWLMDQGCCEPIVAMSGNGAHLLVPIDLPNTDETLHLIKTVLQVLSDKFSDDKVDVDQSVCNAARICRLYGTPARKGDNTAERPHRVSEIRYVPDYLKFGREATPESALQKIASLKGPEPSREPRSYSGTTIDRRLVFSSFLSRLGIPYKVKDSKKGEIHQIQCPFDVNHKIGDAYVGQLSNGPLVFHCSHNSCNHRKWSDFTAQVGKPEGHEWNPPWEPRAIQQPPAQIKTATAAENKPQPPKEPVVVVTTLKQATLEFAASINEPKQQLAKLGLSDLDWCLNGGVAASEMILMAARPSHGKSMIALQAIHNLTAAGVECAFMSEEMSKENLGQRSATYISAGREEHWRENQDALKREVDVFYHGRAPCHIIENSRTAEKLCDRVRNLRKEHDIRAVVVDYAQLLTSKGNGRYEQVTNTSIALKQLTNELNLIMIVLCQLNREVEKRSSFTPQMSDLRDSGQLEQDADVLIGLVWPHQLDESRPHDEYLMYVMKNRNRGIRRALCPCKIEPDRQRIVAPASEYDNSFS